LAILASGVVSVQNSAILERHRDQSSRHFFLEPGRRQEGVIGLVVVEDDVGFAGQLSEYGEEVRTKTPPAHQ
jgi:hypothetical protein